MNKVQLQNWLYPKVTNLPNIFLLEVNLINPSLDYIFFLYPLYLQNLQKIKD